MYMYIYRKACIHMKKCVVVSMWMSLCVEYAVYRGIYVHEEMCISANWMRRLHRDIVDEASK